MLGIGFKTSIFSVERELHELRLAMRALADAVSDDAEANRDYARAKCPNEGEPFQRPIRTMVILRRRNDEASKLIDAIKKTDNFASTTKDIIDAACVRAIADTTAKLLGEYDGIVTHRSTLTDAYKGCN
jgi:hypothetical protein